MIDTAAIPPCHTAPAPALPKNFTICGSRRSVTHVKWAVVQPVSPCPSRSRSSKHTLFPVCFNKYAAVSPVIPPPITTTSYSAFFDSFGYSENFASSQADFELAIIILLLKNHAAALCLILFVLLCAF